MEKSQEEKVGRSRRSLSPPSCPLPHLLCGTAAEVLTDGFLFGFIKLIQLTKLKSIETGSLPSAHGVSIFILLLPVLAQESLQRTGAVQSVSAAVGAAE